MLRWLLFLLHFKTPYLILDLQVGESGITMFYGNYIHSIDDKGRLVIPSKIRHQCGSKLFAMMGFEKCLSLFPENNFEKLVSTIDQHDFNQKDARDYIRMALSSAIELEIDDHGRVQLSVDTMKDFKLNKNVRVIGVNDHLEIWPEDVWLQYQKEQRDQFEAKAEKLSKGKHE